MSFASLGPGPATDALQALLGDVPDATVALTQASANPAGPGVELTVAGYIRQSIAWTGSAGLWHNAAAAAWGGLPEGSVIGGYVVLNSVYLTLSNPLAWVDLALPIAAVADIAFVIPAHSIIVQGFTAPV